jgi:hypothetical protein
MSYYVYIHKDDFKDEDAFFRFAAVCGIDTETIDSIEALSFVMESNPVKYFKKEEVNKCY